MQLFSRLNIVYLLICLPSILKADDAVQQASFTSETEATYLLKYQLRPGELIQSRVTHLAKTMTKMNTQAQASHSRTVSTKTWKVLSVDEQGNMTFENSVQEVDASQQVGELDEVRYNSNSGEVPKSFEEVDNKVDQAMGTIKITPNGEVIERSSDAQYATLGMGDIAIRFPTNSVAIGDQWESEREIQVRRPDKTPLRVKLREVFKLKKVSAGVAVIQIRNEPITPIRNPEVEAQVMQQLNNGTIRFDIDAGRLLQKELSWDSTVIGFSGPGSRLEYAARLDEVAL